MAVNLSPVGGVAAQFFDNSGNVLTGGKLYTYLAGTTTPAVTYTTNAGGVAWSNPIILDAAGRVSGSGEVWLTDGIQYKFILRDSNDVLIATYDNITGINSNFVNFTNNQEIQTATAGQTVFNLTTMQYQPGTNSLSVFVDGVNQYGPGAQYAYIETDQDTVTFVNGLHVGALVKFTTSQINSAAATDAEQVSYTPPFINSVPTNVEAKLAQTISVKDFGATGDGVTDDTNAVQAALNASTRIFFPPGDYVISSVSIADDNVEINCSNATLINNGGTFLFDIGVTSDTPVYSGVKIYGGKFQQANPATSNNQNYIRIRGIENFVIRDCYMENVSNGGIYVEAGCENGLIDGCTIIGATAYSTIRGIWLIGATASDYQSNYMDDASLTRNATPFPVYAVKNVRVTNCRVATTSYGIYNMNTRDCVFENNYVSDFGGARGITINTYSPRAIIKNNTIVGSGTTSGILVTQASNGVIIDGNDFLGSFGGGRVIQVQFLADALITNNQFLCDGSQAIDLNTAGTAIIKSNTFYKTYAINTRAVYALPVDRNIAGTGTYGTTATVVSGFVFENNTMSGWPCGVLLGTNAASNGNEPGWIDIVVRGNLQYKMDLASTSSEYLLRPINTSSTQSFTVQYYDNWVYPASAAGRNLPLVSGNVIFERNDYYMAAFTVSVATSGGAITVSKSYGANFDLAVTRTGTNLTLTPRTPKGATAQDVPFIVGVTPISNNFVTFKLTETTNDWAIELITSGGSALDMTTASASFVVHLSGVVS